MSKLRKLSKEKRKLIRAVIKGYDWDYEYLLALEKAKLENMRDYFATSKIAVGNEREAERIALCVRLLDIMIEEPIYYGYVNCNNAFRFGVSADFSGEFVRSTLRICKAEQLYYKLRANWTGYWWD